jgi:hypothetical protein
MHQVIASCAQIGIGGEDLDRALHPDLVSAPQRDERCELSHEAPLIGMVMEDAWHAGVRQNVGISLQHTLSRERPVVLRATCVPTTASGCRQGNRAQPSIARSTGISQ